MRTHISPSAGALIVDKIKPHEGGTGQTTANQALIAMGAIPAAALNQPDGIAQLDAFSRLSASLFEQNDISSISVTGPVSVAFSSISTFIITNYDVFTSYEITTISGQIVREGAQLTYFAPSTTGAGGFVINGRVFDVTVDSIRPVVPSLLVTSTIGSVSGTAALVGNGTAFAMNSGTGAHLNTDWQVASDAAFTTIVSESLADAVNKTSWTSGNLALSTPYYMRCRYRDAYSAVSAWSDGVAVSSKAAYVPTIQTARLIASDYSVSVGYLPSFGRSVSLDNSSTRLAVGAPGTIISGTTSAGAVYIFTRTGSTWTQEAKLASSDLAAGDRFGYSVSIDSTGTRVVAGADQANVSAVSDTGAAYIFTRTGTTWVQEAKLVATVRLASDYFGSAVDIDDAGTRVAVGAVGVDINSDTTNVGAVYIFTRAGTTWAQEAKLMASVTGSGLGCAVSLDSTGTRVAAGATQTGQIPAAYIFTRTGTAWTQEAALASSDDLTSNGFGYSVSIDSAGTRLAVGAPYVGPVAGAGGVYLFTRTGVTWRQEAKLTENVQVSTNYFGTSVSLDSGGMTVAVGNRSSSDYGHIFARSDAQWSEAAVFNTESNVGYNGFGQSISLSSDGTRLAVGANNAGPQLNATEQVGATYIYNS